MLFLYECRRCLGWTMDNKLVYQMAWSQFNLWTKRVPHISFIYSQGNNNFGRWRVGPQSPRTAIWGLQRVNLVVHVSSRQKNGWHQHHWMRHMNSIQDWMPWQRLKENSEALSLGRHHSIYVCENTSFYQTCCDNEKCAIPHLKP